MPEYLSAFFYTKQDEGKIILSLFLTPSELSIV